jgi:hypothetical protein
MESVEQTFSGNADVGQKATCTVARNGDLMHRVYLRVELPEVVVAQGTETTTGAAFSGATYAVSFKWADKVGLALLKSVELQIGGQKVDKHYGDWMNIWNELSLTKTREAAYGRLVCSTKSDHPVHVAAVSSGVSDTSKLGVATGTLPAVVLNVPLEFWFCRNPCLALPLIALQYHDVKFDIEFNEAKYLGALSATVNATTSATPGTISKIMTATVNGTTVASTTVGLTASGGALPGLSSASTALTRLNLTKCSLWVDYVFLDTDERRRFSQVSHEYLIEQLQYVGEEITSSATYNSRLNFNHPVKELVWVAQPEANVSDSLDNPHTGTGVSPGTYATVADTLVTRPSHQFNYQDYRLTSAASSVVNTTATAVNPVDTALLQLNGHERFKVRDGTYFNAVQPFAHHTKTPSDLGINVYSFGLKPEEHQPSGTCNFSRIDNATLQLKFVNSGTGYSKRLRVYAVNYNVLRILSGMGGTAFSS